MKKILKFAFAIVAMACVVLASASCGKDDDSYGGLDEVVPSDPVVKNGSIAMYEIKGYGKIFDINWRPITCLDDTAKIQYELWMSEDDGETWKQFPKQESTVFHFDKNYMGLLKNNVLYKFKVAVYYWWKGARRRFSWPESYSVWQSFNSDKFELEGYTDNFFQLVIDENTIMQYDSLKVTLCDIDSEEKIQKRHKEWTYIPNETTKYLWWGENNTDWSGVIYLQYYAYDGLVFLDYFRQLTKDTK